MDENKQENNNLNNTQIVTPIQLDQNGAEVDNTNYVLVSKESKKNKINIFKYIITILIILALLIFYIFYFLLPKDFTIKKDSSTVPTTKVTNNYVNNHISSYKIYENDYIMNNYEYTIDKNFSLSYLSNKLVINNNIIGDVNKIYSTIGVVDDVLLLFVNIDNKYNLLGVTNKGEVVYKLVGIDNVKDMILGEKIFFNSVSFEIEGTRLNNNKLIINSNTIEVCNEMELNNNNISGKYLVKGTYTIEYLGNHMFSTPKVINSLSLEEYIGKNNLCK